MKPNLPLLTGSLLIFVSGAILAQDEAAVPPAPEDTQVPVAEEGLAEDALATVPEVDEEELLLSEFSRFKMLVEQGSLDEADTVAKRIIEIAIRAKGPQSNEMAKALTNLAIVQHRSNEFEAAQQNYQSAIEIIEENEDRLNVQLVNPLKGLAAAQLESGRPDLATATYGRAVHVTHVNEGPHNLMQVNLLEDLAEVKLRMGDLDSARDVQETIYALNARAHRNDALGLIPALMKRAEWQHRAGLIFDERATYRRVIRIIQQRLGKEDLALVEPLIRLGRSFFFVDLSGDTSYMNSTATSGEIYFKQALRISKENPDTTWRIIADATLALGDYYMYEGNSQRARHVYDEAWELLSTPEYRAEKLNFRSSELESSVVLRRLPVAQYVGESDPRAGATPDDPAQKGTVSVTYGISPQGRTGNVQIIEAIPPEFVAMQQSVGREVRRRLYRPRFQDGEPIETTGHVSVHTYWYKQSDLDAAREAALSSGDDAGNDDT
ncbi:MAG: tetratricopeptide repeat protein [Woeseiaceae bacterium]|nr:tetratricopeptide repeat protein [Woeseiaceae bacterium]